mgnify:CR=1 FL=1|jgi:hypothetical protein
MFDGLCDSFVCTDLHDSITSEKIKLIIPEYKKFSGGIENETTNS